MEPGHPARRVLESDDGSPATARRHVLTVCRDLPREVVDAAVLLTSELVTNAVQHGEGEIVLTVSLHEGHLRIEVEDHGRGTPEVETRGPLAHDGRGLVLLDALAADWGTSGRESEVGTRVWFHLPTTA